MFLNAIQPDDPGLGGFFKKAFRRDPLRRVLSKGLKRDRKFLVRAVRRDPVFKAVKRSDMSVKRYVARNKWAQGVLYVAGAVLAPFTGGLSLAAAAAAVQSSKAAAKGRSYGRQFAQGVGAGTIGWVAGVGIAYVAAGVAGGGAAGGAGTAAGAGGYGVVAGAAGAPIAATTATTVASAGWLSTFGQAALVGMSLARTLAARKDGSASDPGTAYGPYAGGYGAPATGVAPNSYGYGGGSGGGDASGGGGGGGAPSGTDPNAPDSQSASTLQTLQPYLPYAAAGLGVILLLSLSRRKRR